MGVQLNIKDAETVRLARELADATGQPVTQAIKQALERELAVLRDDKNARREEFRAIVREARKRWKPEYDGEELSVTYKDHLYDERGLPK
ncbi:type II toxin-antitoxin system VapB family antitoxin [Sphingomonas sp.]|uniref:type II toxin-antitoxin system VapB family antitoxin n=1 Tax=Sphingomonas sp. TaxID=28214 RepID=UPI002ED82AC6